MRKWLTNLQPRLERRPRVRLNCEKLEDRLVLATLPANFYELPITSSLNAPTAMAATLDGRLFICQQGGALRVVDGLALQPTPFTTVTTSSFFERGLIGVAINPYNQEQVYVYYTVPSAPIHNRISRFTMNPANRNVAIGPEEILFELPTLSAGNHNGGGMVFNPYDGLLYVGVGENAVPANAQSMTTTLGKVLRLDPENYYGNGIIPNFNPFYGSATGNNRAIYALGFRNPYTLDASWANGDVYVNDVGGSGATRREEVNRLQAGGNYGWNGSRQGYTPAEPQFVSPLFAYGPGQAGYPNNISINGAAFYNPLIPDFVLAFPPSMTNSFFFGDLGGGFIKRIDGADAGNPRTPQNFASGINPSPGAYNLVDLETDPIFGFLYYLEISPVGRLTAIYHYTGGGPGAPGSGQGGNGGLVVRQLEAVATESLLQPATVTTSVRDEDEAVPQAAAVDQHFAGSATDAAEVVSSILTRSGRPAHGDWSEDLFPDVLG